jgi:tryptophan synthase beta chain
MSPIVSHLKELGLIEAQAVKQTPCFEAGVQFARCEGIVPAPESTHAVRVGIDEAMKAKAAGTSPTILIGLSGHGHFDMAAYTEFFSGKLQDLDYDEGDLQRALAQLPPVAA